MIKETKALILTGENIQLARDIVGDNWWNDNEGIYCIPLKELSDEDLDKIGIEVYSRKYVSHVIFDF